MVLDSYGPTEGEVPAAHGKISCPLCQSAVLVARHCKRLCERCGYVESCEDNFLPITVAGPDSIDL